MAVRVQPVEEWQGERGHYILVSMVMQHRPKRPRKSAKITQDKPANDLVAKRQTFTGLKRSHGGPSYNQSKKHHANLHAHDDPRAKAADIARVTRCRAISDDGILKQQVQDASEEHQKTTISSRDQC